MRNKIRRQEPSPNGNRQFTTARICPVVQPIGQASLPVNTMSGRDT
ncbi:MAG: hypothetical protein HRF42_06430 [Candidatus Brocadia sp.]